jgi:hypothetical protein
MTKQSLGHGTAANISSADEKDGLHSKRDGVQIGRGAAKRQREIIFARVPPANFVTKDNGQWAAAW